MTRAIFSSNVSPGGAPLIVGYDDTTLLGGEDEEDAVGNLGP